MGHRSSELHRRRRRRLTRRSTLVAVAVAAGLIAGTLGLRTALEPAAVHSAVAAADAPADRADAVSDGGDDGAPGQTGTAEGATKAPAPKRDEKAAPPKAIPKDQPERGLVYAGLSLPTSDRCGNMLEVTGSTQCSHGPDVPPKDVDIHKDVQPVAAPVAQAAALTPPTNAQPPAAADLLKGGAPVLDATQKALLSDSGAAGAPQGAPSQAPAAGSGLVCEGDGSSGNRVQVVYVHTPGNDRFAQYLPSFKKWAADVDVIYDASAQETGGDRHVRFVTEPDCTASVLNVQISDSEIQDFNASNQALAAQGFNRKDRKYMMFTDAKVYCGIGTFAGDERPGQDNFSNFGPSYGRTDAGCWGGHTAAHELGHNLGAVNNSAPDSSKAGHCTDTWDLMCYSDAPYYPKMRVVCPDRAHDDRLDCSKDDYFNTAPKPGSYLSTHWNVANNRFLIAGNGTGPNPNPTPTPTPTATGSPTRTPSPSPTPTGSPTATPTGSPSPTATPTTGGGSAPEVTSSQITQNSVMLSWNAVPAAAGYDVLLNGQTIGTVRSTVVGVVRLAPGTSYTVAVAVRDAAGAVSKPGRSATFRTLADAGHPQPGTHYTLVNGLTGQAADLWGSSMNDGTVAIAYQRTGYANQKWAFEDAGDGAVRIKSARSGKCLQLGGTAVAGQYVAQQPCADNAAQKWQLGATDGGFTVTAAGSTLVLGLSDRWYYGGWLLELQQPNGRPYQSWSLLKTS
ncbi:RICIN domain-containing protein [Kitasatospora sp. NPDC048296]|uniref:RICIN domain-containing protein n=1 Tax=Kitasatospora sp. NPDC048296 TaxID=3364048 RepID=UPI0037240CDD